MTSIAPRFILKRMKNGQAPSTPGEYREVIIIGADGFLGSFISRYLTESGWKVFPTVFSRSPEKNEIRLDVRKPEDFRKLPEKIPLINTAGLPDQSAGISLMREVHIQGMKNLVSWAEKTDCPHIIHTSSVAVYGNATVGTGRSEIATPRRSRNPLTAPLPYGRTKARAEVVLEKSGLPWSGLRFPAIYGPGDSFFTRQLRLLLEDSNKPLPPGGNKRVSIMPVDQTGSLMESLLNHGPLNTALNAAGSHIPWETILEAYADAWGKELRKARHISLKDFLKFSDPGRQMAAYYAAFGAEFPDSEIRRILNWQPGGDWRKTVRRAAEAETRRQKTL